MPKISDFLTVTTTDATSVVPIVEIGSTNRNKTMSITNLKAQLFTPATSSVLGVVKVGTSLTVSGAGLLDVATPLPSQTGNANKFLKTDGAGNLSWAATDQFSRVITPEIEGTNNGLAIYSNWAKDTGISIVSQANLESVTLTSDRIVAITTDFGSAPKNWIFDTDGTITWPDSTVQSTAHPLDVVTDTSLIQGVASLVITGTGVSVSSVGNAVTLDISGGASTNTGDFIFAVGDASLPPGGNMTLSTYQSGGNKESRLTLSTSGISSLDVGNNLRITTGYGTGFEKVWTFGATGTLTFPDASTFVGTGDITFSSNEIRSINNAVKIVANSDSVNKRTLQLHTDGIVEIPVGAAGAGIVHSSAGVWLSADGVYLQLNANGSVDFPLVSGNTTSLIRSTGSTTLNSNGKEWLFDNNGSLTLPGAVIKSTVAKTGGPQLTPTAIDLTKSVNKMSSTSGGYYTLADGVEGQLMYLTQQDATAGMYVNVTNARINGTLDTNAELTFSAVNGNVITLLFIDGAWQQGGGEWAA